MRIPMELHTYVAKYYEWLNLSYDKVIKYDVKCPFPKRLLK